MIDVRSHEEKFDGKSFCTLPFIHLASHPIGTVTPCCVADMTGDISSSKNGDERMFLGVNSLNEVTNSESFKEIRRQMLNNEFPNACRNCYLYEKDNIYSKRIESNFKFGRHIEDCFKRTLPDGTLSEIDYKYIELRLGTICNLKCVTCNPFSSSKWNEDTSAFKDTQFMNDYPKNDVKNEWFRSHEFYDDLYDKCSGLEEVWINGGEPTLIKEHSYFLERLVKSGRSKSINIHYSINLSYLHEHYFELWKQFKNVRLHLSIDDLAERNDYIRYGAVWEKTMENFKRILLEKNVFHLEICQTVSALNVMNINRFKKFSLDHGIIVAHNFVHHPSHLSVNILPEEMKMKLASNLSFLSQFERHRLISELNRPCDPGLFDKFLDFMRILDKQRKTNIGAVLPEWADYF